MKIITTLIICFCSTLLISYATDLRDEEGPKVLAVRKEMEKIEGKIALLPKKNSEAMRLFYRKYLYNFDQLLKKVIVDEDIDIEREIARVHIKSNPLLDIGGL